jgi:hypothetical protein
MVNPGGTSVTIWIKRQAPWNTLPESSRLYSPAMARLTPFTIVEIGLPSFSNCSAQ